MPPKKNSKAPTKKKQITYKVSDKTTGTWLFSNIRDAVNTKTDVIVLYGAKYTKMIDTVIYLLLSEPDEFKCTIIPSVARYTDKEGTERHGRRKELTIYK